MTPVQKIAIYRDVTPRLGHSRPCVVVKPQLRWKKGTHICRAAQEPLKRFELSKFRRRDLFSLVPFCPCACCAQAGDLDGKTRNTIYDEYFARTMATSMQGYEEQIAPVKRLLFEQVSEAAGQPGGVDILEIGIGTGPNLSYYASEGTRVTGLEPNAAMFPYAKDTAAAVGLSQDKLSLVQGCSEVMPFPDDSFDYVISTLTLCSVPQLIMTMLEIQRVLRPGAKLLFIEHVLSQDPILRRVQTFMSPLQGVFADGCHLDRETGLVIENCGFASVDMMRFHVENATLISPHVSGTAVVSGVERERV